MINNTFNHYKKNISISYVQLIWYTYISILMIAWAISSFSSISNYNAIVLLVFDIVLLFIHRNKIILKIWILFCFILSIINIIFHANILYSLIDCGILFFILTLIDFSINYTINCNTLKQIQNTCGLFLIISLFGIIMPNTFINGEDGNARYGGVFHAINLSSNIFAIIEICFWEVHKRIRKTNKWILLSLLIALIIYTDLSGTRSLLFFYPYWIFQFYQLFRQKNSKLLFIIVVLILLSLIPSIITLLITKLRFQEGESSMATRVVLYEQLIKGIVSHYGFIPHGSNSAQEMIVAFTQENSYSPHNNFLSYLYDWGIIFIFLIYKIYKILRRNKLTGINMTLIYLGLSSCALHNMLFSPFLWIPLCIILIINYEYSNGKTYISSCS